MLHNGDQKTPVNLPIALPVHVRVPSLRTTDGRIWNYLGSGSYNNVYRLHEGDLVYKIPRNEHFSETEDPSRAVRLWNLINSDLVPAAALLDEGWIAPYISGTIPIETDICHSLIDIYNRTKRIVVDPGMSGNFIKQEGSGKTICVDIGYALRMDVLMSKSQDSLDCWLKMRNVFDVNMDNGGQDIANMAWALLFIAENYPEIENVDVLKNNPDLVLRLSTWFGQPTLADDHIILSHFTEDAAQLQESKNSFPRTQQTVKNELLAGIQAYQAANQHLEIQLSAPQKPSVSSLIPGFFSSKEEKRENSQYIRALETLIDRLNRTQNLSQLTRLLLEPNPSLPSFSYLITHYPVCFRLINNEAHSESLTREESVSPH